MGIIYFICMLHGSFRIYMMEETIENHGSDSMKIL